jgi:predicted enzyme related to lactoylglutathione lyase
MTQADARGRFVWYELLTADPKAAPELYKRLFGWGTQSWGFGPLSYTLWTRGTAPMGGVKPLPEGAARSGTPPHWLPYIAVPDVGATAKQAEALGARIYVAPKSVPMIGQFAVLADPQGAAFAVVTPGMALPADVPPAVGQFSWHELAAADPASAFAFYQALFGWEARALLDMGPAGPYQTFGRADRPLGGVYKKMADAPGPPGWLLYVRVEDVGRSAADVEAHGGRLLSAPIDVPNGDRVITCADAQGAAFALHQIQPT